MVTHSVDCAGLDGCPDVEAHRDPRLDPGVKAARRAEWIRDDQWDGDTGWLERNIIAVEPNPAYSRPDRMDGLTDDITNPPFPPVRAADVTQHPLPPLHGYHRLFGWAIVGAAFAFPVSLFAAIWVMSGGAW